MCILSIPRKTLFAESDRLLRRNLTWLAAAGGLALLMGWLGSNLLIVRPVKTLVKTSSRLASGDLSARTGLRHGRDELGLLMASFDQMAQALEEREKGRLQAAKKLAALSHRLVEVQESERRSIARELHDEIGQSLTAAEMNLQLALRAPGGKQVAPRLRASIEAVEQVLAQVHDLSLSLRPSMLDDLGLEAALRWYSQRQAELAGFKAEFHPVPLERRLDPIIETECFRIAQEALNNVVRHAKAKCVAIRLAINDAELHLCVADDGAGFHVEELRAQAVRGASLGLLSMEERAVLAGGGFNLSSSPGRGTEIRAWFPLRWQGSERTFSTST
jgi:signal transduction histidine kinase